MRKGDLGRGYGYSVWVDAEIAFTKQSQFFGLFSRFAHPIDYIRWAWVVLRDVSVVIVHIGGRKSGFYPKDVVASQELVFPSIADCVHALRGDPSVVEMVTNNPEFITEDGVNGDVVFWNPRKFGRYSNGH